MSGAGGRVLRVETGHAQRWPGVTLKPAAGDWDLSAYAWLVLPVRNAGKEVAAIHCRVDNAGADGVRHCVTGSVQVPPGQVRSLRVELKRSSGSTLEGRLFGMRGYPVATGGERTIDPHRVAQILVFVSEPKVDHVFEVGALRAEGESVPPTASVTDADPYFPLIDTFGQYRHRDWPGKTLGPGDLQRQREAEEAEHRARPGPSDWSRYGGWAGGPRLRATGFFRVERHGGKWWLVDPEGFLFFSHGVDCVRMQEFTPISEREAWFEDFPGNRPEFAGFFLERASVLKGYYVDKSPRCFSFASANLFRKYGPDWRTESAAMVHRRLRSWGMNTIGMWSDESTRLLRRTPYVDAIGSQAARRIEGSEGYWGKFPDPFDPGFRATLEKGMAGRRGASAGDPWCLGFFCDNELAWGDETSLSLAALRSPADQAVKRVFLEELRARHVEIAALNRLWGTSHASWEALMEDRAGPDPQRARADLVGFYERIADEYFRVVREVIRTAAPEQLFLGCRFAWVNERAAAAAAKHCDVVSYNLYQRGVADFKFNGGRDVPLIIGEFHFGALDRGMFHTGLVPTANQAERATAYRDYVRGALRHPQFVGTHWFQYQDQPTTGRFLDEENYQIGLVDIVDTPYPETLAAVRDVGYGMYTFRMGQ